MKKWFKLLRKQENNYVQLVSANCQVIKEYNERMLFILTLMGGFLMLLPLFVAPFSRTKTGVIPFYLISAALFFMLFFLSRFSFVKKYVLLMIYFSFSILFLFAIYLSVIHTPTMRATILLGVFCIMPLGFIDRPVRMSLFVAFWFAVHTILAFKLKPLYALDDTINCLCFAVVGCFIGNIMLWVRLDSYEAHRLLVIEKETDVLTNLFNRRKLFETLVHLETEDSQKPSGILMIDIDNFKYFNDIHGHATGDKCLNYLGETLKEFTKTYRLNFYRYGGEEFVAIAYGYEERKLLSIAESIRISVENIEMDNHRITVSIGVAYCGDEQVRNYENIIDRADKAAYTAKRTGRNKVCRYQLKI